MSKKEYKELTMVKKMRVYPIDADANLSEYQAYNNSTELLWNLYVNLGKCIALSSRLRFTGSWHIKFRSTAGHKFHVTRASQFEHGICWHVDIMMKHGKDDYRYTHTVLKNQNSINKATVAIMELMELCDNTEK